MKATGIVRRVDDLGRIVIPKEIRRTLKIREGGPHISLERVMGIGPTLPAWKAGILPLNYTRITFP